MTCLCCLWTFFFFSKEVIKKEDEKKNPPSSSTEERRENKKKRVGKKKRTRRKGMNRDYSTSPIDDQDRFVYREREKEPLSSIFGLTGLTSQDGRRLRSKRFRYHDFVDDLEEPDELPLFERREALGEALGEARGGARGEASGEARRQKMKCENQKETSNMLWLFAMFIALLLLIWFLYYILQKARAGMNGGRAPTTSAQTCSAQRGISQQQQQLLQRQQASQTQAQQAMYLQQERNKQLQQQIKQQQEQQAQFQQGINPEYISNVDQSNLPIFANQTGTNALVDPAVFFASSSPSQPTRGGPKIQASNGGPNGSPNGSDETSSENSTNAAAPGSSSPSPLVDFSFPLISSPLISSVKPKVLVSSCSDKNDGDNVYGGKCTRQVSLGCRCNKCSKLNAVLHQGAFNLAPRCSSETAKPFQAVSMTPSVY